MGRRGSWTPPIRKQVVLGEEGFFLLRYTGADLTEPFNGEYTGHEYRFNERRVLLVDKRDAIYLMGPDFEVM